MELTHSGEIIEREAYVQRIRNWVLSSRHGLVGERQAGNYLNVAVRLGSLIRHEIIDAQSRWHVFYRRVGLDSVRFGFPAWPRERLHSMNIPRAIANLETRWKEIEGHDFPHELDWWHEQLFAVVEEIRVRCDFLAFSLGKSRTYMKLSGSEKESHVLGMRHTLGLSADFLDIQIEGDSCVMKLRLPQDKSGKLFEVRWPNLWEFNLVTFEDGNERSSVIEWPEGLFEDGLKLLAETTH